MRVKADRQNCLQECGKLMQKAPTQNVSHMIETTQAQTARYFLPAGWAKWTGTNGMSLKITSKDKGGSRRSKEPH